MAAFLFSAAFADCGNATREAGASTSSAKEQLAEPDRTVLLALMLSKSGTVRHVRVLQGSPMLASAAIKAAKGRRYKDTAGYTLPFSHETLVSVTFDNNQQPKIRPASLGVSGCLHVAGPRRIIVPVSPLPALLADFLRQQPSLPVLSSETKK